jgi:hypothetical protein
MEDPTRLTVPFCPRKAPEFLMDGQALVYSLPCRTDALLLRESREHAFLVDGNVLQVRCCSRNKHFQHAWADIVMAASVGVNIPSASYAVGEDRDLGTDPPSRTFAAAFPIDSANEPCYSDASAPVRRPLAQGT